MNAQQARELTEKNLYSSVIEALLARIYQMIQGAAANGRSEIVHPFQGLEVTEYPSLPMKEAIFETLRKQGYTVERHTNPDPGNPSPSDYDSVSW